MATLKIGGRKYIVIQLNFSTPGNHLQVYNCQDCSALVTDADLHNVWHQGFSDHRHEYTGTTTNYMQGVHSVSSKTTRPI